MSNRWLFFPAPVSSDPKFVWTATTNASSSSNTLQCTNEVFAGSDGGSSNYYKTWGPIRQSTSVNYFELVFKVQGAYTFSSDWLATVPNGQFSSTTISSGTNVLSGSVLSIITFTNNNFARVRWTPTTATARDNFWTLLQAGAAISITLDW